MIHDKLLIALGDQFWRSCLRNGATSEEESRRASCQILTEGGLSASFSMPRCVVLQHLNNWPSRCGWVSGRWVLCVEAARQASRVASGGAGKQLEQVGGQAAMLMGRWASGLAGGQAGKRVKSASARTQNQADHTDKQRPTVEHRGTHTGDRLSHTELDRGTQTATETQKTDRQRQARTETGTERGARREAKTRANTDSDRQTKTTERQRCRERQRRTHTHS